MARWQLCSPCDAKHYNNVVRGGTEPKHIGSQQIDPPPLWFGSGAAPDFFMVPVHCSRTRIFLRPICCSRRGNQGAHAMVGQVLAACDKFSACQTVCLRWEKLLIWEMRAPAGVLPIQWQSQSITDTFNHARAACFIYSRFDGEIMKKSAFPRENVPNKWVIQMWSHAVISDRRTLAHESGGDGSSNFLNLYSRVTVVHHQFNGSKISIF